MRISLIAKFLMQSSLILFVLALFIPVHAETNENTANLLLDASLLHFSYQEFDDNGKLLDKEEGFLPGGKIGLQKNLGRWSLLATVGAYGGYVDYTGQTQTGTPITTRTMQNIVDTTLLAEYWLATGSGTRYAPYAGAGYHYWHRNIQPTHTASGQPVSGLVETYTWYYGLLGLKAEFYKTPDLTWLLDARFFRIARPEIRIDFGGTYDNTTFALGERWGARFAAPAQYFISQQTRLAFEPYIEAYELGRSRDNPLTSGGAQAGTVHEPDSRTVNFGITVGISQQF